MGLARFTGPLITEQIGHERWKVYKAFTFISSTGLSVHIPKDFETDLASIPAIVQGLISKVGHWSQGAVTHDVLYALHRDGLDDVTTRLQADRILREGCIICADNFRVPRRQRRTTAIYLGVRAGGLESWETPDERQVRLAMLDDHVTDE
jgi:hypothetical protein